LPPLGPPPPPPSGPPFPPEPLLPPLPPPLGALALVDDGLGVDPKNLEPFPPDPLVLDGDVTILASDEITLAVD